MSLEHNIKKLNDLFTPLKGNTEAIYKLILEFGSNYTHLPPSEFHPEHIVKGCQSLMYLKSKIDNNRMYFDIYSDALISKGIAALLVSVYSGQSPETLLKSKPDFLKEFGIIDSLSPSRSNGALSLFTKMQQSAIFYLTSKKI